MAKHTYIRKRYKGQTVLVEKQKEQLASRQVKAYIMEHESGAHSLAKASQAMAADSESWDTHLKLVPTPYDPAKLVKLLEKNTWHQRCCKQIASDVAGLGFDIPFKLDASDEDQNNEKNKKIRQEIVDFFNNPNERAETLREILCAAQEDYESTGWMCIEVAVDISGRPQELFHVPAYTVRAKRGNKAYCQIVGQKKVWFSRWGLKNDDGKSLYVNKKDGTISKKVPFGKRGNPMIFIKNYSASSAHYGVPTIISALRAINILLGIGDFNLDFFDNNAIPAWAIIIEGGELDKPTKEYIDKFFKEEIKGAGGAHATLNLETPEGVKITFKRLQTEIKEGSFEKLQTQSRDEILVAHSMPPYRIGIAVMGSLGGNIASEMSRTYKDAVVIPRQETLEKRLTNLIKLGWNTELLQFRFNELDITDAESEAKIDGERLGQGVVTPNIIRKKEGLPLLTKEEGGDVVLVSRKYVPIQTLVGMSEKDLGLPKSEREETQPAETEVNNHAEGDENGTDRSTSTTSSPEEGD